VSATMIITVAAKKHLDHLSSSSTLIHHLLNLCWPPEL
jgi:hypothetical protein